MTQTAKALLLFSIFILMSCADDATISIKKYDKAVLALEKGDQEKGLTYLKLSLEKDYTNDAAALLYSEELLKKNRVSYEQDGTVDFDELYSRTWGGNSQNEDDLRTIREGIIDFLIEITSDTIGDINDIGRLIEIKKRSYDSLSGDWLTAKAYYEVLRNQALINVDSPQELRLFTEYFGSSIDSTFPLDYSSDKPIMSNIISMAINSAAFNSITDSFPEVKKGYFKLTMKIESIVSIFKRNGTANVPTYPRASKNAFLSTILMSEYHNFINSNSSTISPLDFPIPPGWKDYSAVVQQSSDINEIPKGLREYQGARKMLKLYADPRTIHSKNATVIFITWSPGLLEIDDQFINSYSSDVLDKFKADSVKCELLDKEIIEFDNVNVARFLYTFEDIDQISYIASLKPFSILYNVYGTKSKLRKFASDQNNIIIIKDDYQIYDDKIKL